MCTYTALRPFGDWEGTSHRVLLIASGSFASEAPQFSPKTRKMVKGYGSQRRFIWLNYCGTVIRANTVCSIEKAQLMHLLDVLKMNEISVIAVPAVIWLLPILFFRLSRCSYVD